MYVVKAEVCVFLLFLLDGLWPVGAVVDVVEEAVDVLYGTQLLTAQRPLCIFCAAASYLCIIISNPNPNSIPRRKLQIQKPLHFHYTLTLLQKPKPNQLRSFEFALGLYYTIPYIL